MNIVIVGGVAGGMSAATRARRLDETAHITVFEKGPYVSYANCGIPYALGKVIEDDGSLILQTPKSFRDRFNIDVRLNTEAITIDREKRLVHVRTTDTEEQHHAPYDKLILAQGAEPFRPPIEGIGLPNVFTLQTIMDLQSIRCFMSEHRVKKTTIIGGGFIGLEAAENLRNLGLEVSLLEYAPHVFPPVDRDMAGPIHAELRRNDVRVILNARVQQIQLGCVVQASGEEIPTDLVLLAVGIRARAALARQAGLKVGKAGVSVNEFMQTSDPDIYAVGDMVETEHRIAARPLSLALAGPANRQGRLAADHIFGKAIRYRGNVGTAVCKVFDLTVAATGLSVSSLRQAGYDPLWVTVHPPDHAGYYPGANSIMLKVAFERQTGRLLGAQAVGKTNVDKRIDVLSTTLQAGMTIFDLEHLELAYAPPFGSAKDPVNMAGFVGSNVLRGDTEIVHTEDLANTRDLDQMQLVDVRSQKEFARGHIPFARNLPVNSLRDGLSGLDKSRRVVVYCQVGYRGYLAYRILKQNGFDAVNLDGGYRSVVEGYF
ncbi:hypothetical protein MPH_13504 [Macrophomina phaseolina MS6]|uniref:Rhodanese domain-containing protein n=1 Tax=Macrophomina phaseolina (strain MS6) TaxID=1126212 RepID=K2RYE2_MACPH|nr:hypothetical protein MPH_13504 [Macrophomina phaseolina MS6]